jgi:hypothetical protein
VAVIVGVCVGVPKSVSVGVVETVTVGVSVGMAVAVTVGVSRIGRVDEGSGVGVSDCVESRVGIAIRVSVGVAARIAVSVGISSWPNGRGLILDIPENGIKPLIGMKVKIDAIAINLNQNFGKLISPL